VLTSLLFLSRPLASPASPDLWNSDRSGASANLSFVDVVARQPLWTLRGLWVLLALVAAGPVAEVLEEPSAPVAVVAAVGLAAAWTAVLVALLVPRAQGLTAVRLLVPSVAVAAATAGVSGATTSAQGWAAAAVAVACTGVALAPPVADALVDGSSYGPERRIPLRTPVAVAALGVVAWALAVAGAVSGPLLLATGTWAPGVIATVLGAAVTVAAVRSLHQLSRRWLVLVPTGMVLHDPLTMPEPQLFLRQTMERLGPARPEGDPDTERDAETQHDTQDLTAGASGLVTELRLGEPVELLVYTSGRATALRSVRAVRFTPARPAVLLREASQRRLPVG
jgi:hypothetical protein